MGEQLTEQVQVLDLFSETLNKSHYYPTYYIKSNDVFLAISWIGFHYACHRTIDWWIVLDMDRYYTMAWYTFQKASKV